MTVLDKINDGDKFETRCGYEYQHIGEYEGQHPFVIIGVYRKPSESGWHPIAHTADGWVSELGRHNELDLVPLVKTFMVKVERTVVERAYITIEARDEDEASDKAPEEAEDRASDLDWEEYSANYETLDVKEDY